MHVTSVSNVEATLDNYFVTQLSYINREVWFPSYNIAYDFPEAELVTPCFSFTHIPVSINRMAQGDVESEGFAVTQAVAIIEINAWVSRDDKYNGQDVWVARLRFMHSMVQEVYTRSPVVVIQDVVTDPNYPAPAPYKIDLMGMTAPNTLPDDANPSLRRRRMLITYGYKPRAEV